MEKQYNFKENEEQLYKEWAKKDAWEPKGTGKPFVMVIPPPNVTGSLHMGHALNTTCQDILARYYRQKGRPVKWVVGTDHAGIATQTKVEKALLKKGIKKNEISKEEFLKHIWEWKKEHGDQIIHQLQRLGASCDWSKIHFTMDDDYQKAVKTAFKHFYDQGLIYQADRVVNWCVRCQTSLSDLEVEYRPEKAKLWHIKYPVKISELRSQNQVQNLKSSKNHEPRTTNHDYIVVATTRSETMLGDSAVAVNPKDERYKNLIGQTVILPITGREIPIVSDSSVDMKFGTGAVKVTPAHDMLDSEIGERQKLESIQVIDKYGKIMTEGMQEFRNLGIKECREKIIEELEKQSLIEKVEEIEHNLSVCYRCEREIEPMPSKQWFIDMNHSNAKCKMQNAKSQLKIKNDQNSKSLKELGMEAVRSGKVQFVPKKWEKVYLDWMENVKDWCISRQLIWGHKIPIEGETDVLDTWFSSALWSFATLGYPEKIDEKYYPTTVLSTARDIIYLWVSRMIFSSVELIGEIPFEKVYIHPTIYNQEGKRMSKSLGTGVDPIELIDKYGADAVRFGLTLLNTGVQDIKFNEVHIVAGRKFANKLHNIARYIDLQIQNSESRVLPTLRSGSRLNVGKNPIYKKYLEKIEKLETETERDLEQFRFGQALERIYHFIWHDFADKMIEESKADESEEKIVFLQTAFSRLLDLVEPFLPFVSAKIKNILNSELKIQNAKSQFRVQNHS